MTWLWALIETTASWAARVPRRQRAPALAVLATYLLVLSKTVAGELIHLYIGHESTERENATFELLSKYYADNSNITFQAHCNPQTTQTKKLYLFIVFFCVKTNRPHRKQRLRRYHSNALAAVRRDTHGTCLHARPVSVRKLWDQG